MTVKDNMSVRAVGKYIPISPSKVRRVLNQLRGHTYEEALILLEFLPYKACEPIWKVIQSAASNIHNLTGVSKQDLVIEEIFVNTGPVLKRFKPRAQGRGYAINKPMCHITAVVSIKY